MGLYSKTTKQILCLTALIISTNTVFAQVDSLTSVKSISTFGSPRYSSQDDQTKIVFDLPQNARYVLSPTYNGLNIIVQGALVQSQNINSLSNHINYYRASGSQVTIGTNFPLNNSSGWTATEATIASGSRVLIIEFGQNLSGGSSSHTLLSMMPGSGNLNITATPLAPMASSQFKTNINKTSLPVSNSYAPIEIPTQAKPTPSAVAISPSVSSEEGAAPGDDVNIVNTPNLPIEVKRTASNYNTENYGSVSGTGTGYLPSPRIGRHPGLTRFVLDLPPNSSYQIRTANSGIMVSLNNVKVGNSQTGKISDQVKAWSMQQLSDSSGLFTINTVSPPSNYSGWRTDLLPNNDGGKRLIIDVSPAYANNTPLSPIEAKLPAMNYFPVSGNMIYATKTKPRVVLDPGHGGKDPGAVYFNTKEKDVALKLSFKVKNILEAAGFEVIMTRDRDMHLHENKAKDLRMRANTGSRGFLFVSIHANALPAVSALKGYGVETWYNKNHKLTPAFASIIQKNVIDTSGAFSRGIKNYQTLGVLAPNKVPAVLIEVGFMSHPVDILNILADNYLDRVAVGISKGIREAMATGVSAANTETISTLNKDQELLSQNRKNNN